MPSANRPPKPASGGSLDWNVIADEALEEARSMPHGAARSQALKKAGEFRNTADLYGIVFAQKGRPRK